MRLVEHKCVYGSQKLPGSPGKSGEWIVERPCVNPDVNSFYPLLAPFGTQTFRSAHYERYGNSALRDVGYSPVGRDKYWMTDDKGQLLASVFGITNGGTQFQLKWDTYGVQQGC